ncbi:glycoside hydrolase family 10 protein [Aureibacter tunicatorum]|uniref:Uncharacterized lipoprotein YddW (UPF0748 family) n=1 Tax=Aureibacter tunicatorum TaxID=866807 RepID=A0AAE3XJU6_9BACT|nr:family 10 glycosylhydrolase [Aureibacter tunicatorum]MDR6237800.1 uncharacterized lipoprotein YddW (UPF0748 family) [Aureibacter tunicatorum]BDD02835.1 hypothetical protein AUTU_03180 [Aureibacter tunicatorum]
MKKIKIILALSILLLNASLSHSQNLPKREVRGAWIATVYNIDWPSKPKLKSHQQKAEFCAILDSLAELHINTVIVQVRPQSDTFYPSTLEPWSSYLNGKQGYQNADYYNPLSFMIHEAHKRGMEFHAWVNPYRLSMDLDKGKLSPSNPLFKHEEWVVAYGGKYYFNPGIPEVRNYLAKVIREMCTHYDIDAIHMDDYFYPYKVSGEDFPDEVEFARYGNNFDNIEDWRRDNVNKLVENLNTVIKSVRMDIKFGISPFGVWRNKSTDPEGSDSRAGQTNYDDLYADVLLWLKEGWIDYVAPQLYWRIGNPAADYSKLAKWWSEHTYGKHLYIGHSIYKVGDKKMHSDWMNSDQIEKQILLNRELSNVHGSFFYSAKYFMSDRIGFKSQLKANAYNEPALIPEMEWLQLSRNKPDAPSIENIEGSLLEGVSVSWSDNDANSSRKYILYRYELGEALDYNNPKNIIAILSREVKDLHSYVDNNVEKNKIYSYAVSSVDRYNKESAPSRLRTVKVKKKKTLQLN